MCFVQNDTFIAIFNFLIKSHSILNLNSTIPAFSKALAAAFSKSEVAQIFLQPCPVGCHPGPVPTTPDTPYLLLTPNHRPANKPLYQTKFHTFILQTIARYLKHSSRVILCWYWQHPKTPSDMLCMQLELLYTSPKCVSDEHLLLGFLLGFSPYNYDPSSPHSACLWF